MLKLHARVDRVAGFAHFRDVMWGGIRGIVGGCAASSQLK